MIWYLLLLCCCCQVFLCSPLSVQGAIYLLLSFFPFQTQSPSLVQLFIKFKQAKENTNCTSLCVCAHRMRGMPSKKVHRSTTEEQKNLSIKEERERERERKVSACLALSFCQLQLKHRATDRQTDQKKDREMRAAKREFIVPRKEKREWMQSGNERCCCCCQCCSDSLIRALYCARCTHSFAFDAGACFCTFAKLWGNLEAATAAAVVVVAELRTRTAQLSEEICHFLFGVLFLSLSLFFPFSLSPSLARQIGNRIVLLSCWQTLARLLAAGRVAGLACLVRAEHEWLNFKCVLVPGSVGSHSPKHFPDSRMRLLRLLLPPPLQCNAIKAKGKWWLVGR